ncbi:hypothetical protein XF24_00100 [candidate division SR1 bacterium Aalborg_AAW-1]|nr:hypothetical protein XF24_00100 [candidate division SR1 bacterium Aalborg_AAW-1]
MMTTSNEKPIILVIVTFFLALILVYVVYFRVQSAKDVSGQDDDSMLTQSGSQFSSTSFDTSGASQDTNSFQSGSSTSGDSIIAQTLSPLETKIRELSTGGIKPLYAAISVADQLGLTIKTAFTDQVGIQYGYIGTGSLDELAPTVRRLGGNVLAIETRNDIMSNLLRGDRVAFVNIPGTTFVQQQGVEQKLLVAMIVTMGEDRWFIQSPIDQYYAQKANMKSYFEKLYDKTW